MVQDKIIVFAPHPDDETLACGGTIAKKLNEGYDVFVVFMTDARYSLVAVDIHSGPTPRELSAIRKEEATIAMKTLGMREKNLFFLDFEDGTLKKHCREAHKITCRILTDISPTEVYFPQDKEYHKDHSITNFIVQEAIKYLGLDPIKVKYAIAWAFPYNVFTHILDEQTFYSLASRILNHQIIHVDISRFLQLKVKALNAYKTQMMVFSHIRRKNVTKRSFLNRFLKKEEIFFVSPRNLDI